MTSKNLPLGRGLAALLGDIPSPAKLDLNHPQITMLACQDLRASKIQPRRDFNEQGLEELAQSIQKHGLMQPITVRKNGEYFEIIAGERRWRACQKLAMSKLPAIVIQASDEQALALALIENLQRQELNPIEEALAIQRLLEEFHLTHQAIGEVLGQSRAHISNQLRLLQLEPEVQQLLAKGQISAGHARCLIGLETNTQIALAEKIQTHQWSVRQTEKWLQSQTQAPSKISRVKNQPNHQALISQIQTQWQSQFKLRPQSQDQGKLIIEYQNHAELEQILQQLIKG